MGRLGLCFILLCMQCSEGGSLARTVFLIVTVPWSSGIPAPLATRARRSRGVPSVDCACLLALARWLENVGGGACSLASGRHQENDLTMRACGLSNAARECLACVSVHFRLGVGECHDCSCLPVPAREKGRVAAVRTHRLQLGSRKVPQPFTHAHLSAATAKAL